VVTTGGGAKIHGHMEVKRRWTGDFEYEYQDQSSLLGAAMLGRVHQQGGWSPGLQPSEPKRGRPASGGRETLRPRRNTARRDSLLR
jgi:hypothetical protein